jgi:glutaredoxin
MKGLTVTTSGTQGHPSEVTIYTTPTCDWCRVAKDYLVQHQIPYREVDVSGRGTARREMTLMTGSTTVPVIKVGAYAMTGWDESEFQKLMAGKIKRR